MRIVLQGGDNMLGRAVQLTLPYQTPGDADIRDSQTANDYLVGIVPTEDVGLIREWNKDGRYLWGDVPVDLGEDLRILNLEAAPTLSIDTDQDKGILYHVDLRNLPLVFSRFKRPMLVTLGNNHAMDMGRRALVEETLPKLGNVIGVGRDGREAYRGRRVGSVEVWAFAAGCAGVPADWAATQNRAGVAYLPPILSSESVETAFKIIQKSMGPSDKFKVVTIHWGPNWASPGDGQEFRRRLAHRLIDELGVHLIHGHSSHHVRGIELYRGRLILYGAGDLVNDYEQIPHPGYDTAGAVFVVDLDDASFELRNLTVIPFEMKQLSCREITDPVRVEEWFDNVNGQSMRDCQYPLILHF